MGFSANISDSHSSTSDNTQTTGTTNTTKVFDPTSKTALDAQLTSTDYSKASAITDSQTAMQQAIHEALLQGAPSIDVNTRQAGGYNATSTQLLGDDLTARSAAAGSQVLLNTIQGYASSQANLTAANTAAVNATTNTNIAQTGTNSNQKQTNTTGVQAGPTGSGQLTVICTQLYHDGHITRAYYLADIRFATLYFSETTRCGYHFWAIPLVRAMRKNPRLYRIVKYFGIRWSQHCAAAFYPELPLNAVGILMHLTLVPACFLLGLCVKDTDYQPLWTPQSIEPKE